MKCSSCGTHMQLDRTESTDIASTQWHRCPLCSKVRLTSSLNSDLDKPTDYLLGAASVEDDEVAQKISISNATVEPLVDLFE